MSISLYGTSTSEWIELDDKTFNSHFGNNAKYERCKVTVSFIGSNKSYSYNLPIYPNDISESISTNYADYNIIGRPGSISSYTNTSDNTKRITLIMHRELKTFNNQLTDVNEVDRIISLIKAANYPLIDSTAAAIYAPIVTYNFGDTLIVGKQTSCSVKWEGPKIEGKYMQVTLDITVVCTPKKIIDFKDVYNANPRGWGLFD